APQRAAEDVATHLQAGWEDVLRQRGVEGTVRRLASILHLVLHDAALQAGLGDRMREAGVDLLHSSAFCSSVHTPDDVVRSVTALDAALVPR
ncbi:MAG: hypothetical protein ACYDC2_12360, partial [Solirubrobacteraceae bacterium]